MHAALLLAHPRLRHPLSGLLAAEGLTARSGLNAALLALHSLTTLLSAPGLLTGYPSGLLRTAVVGLVLLLGRLPGLGLSHSLLAATGLLTAARDPGSLLV